MERKELLTAWKVSNVDPDCPYPRTLPHPLPFPVHRVQDMGGDESVLTGGSSHQWLGVTSSLGPASRVVEIDWSQQSLTGAISPSLSYLSELQVLNLSQNLLCGTLPEPLFNLRNLVSLNVSCAGLQGMLSPRLAEMSSLAELNMEHNDFYGAVPSNFSRVRVTLVASSR